MYIYLQIFIDQRITSFIDKHNTTLDIMYTSDKINIIVD